MKTRTVFAKIASLSLVALGLMSQVVWAQGNGGNQPSFVPGRILVKFRDGVGDGQARGLLAGRGALSTNVIPQIGVHIVQLPPNANEQAEANAFKGLDEVEFAEVDQIVAPSSITPNDPYYYLQWHLPKMSAPDAWSVSTGSSVVTAIVDTGVDGTHQDLSAKMIAGWNIVDGNTNTSDASTHGTQAAGTAAATTNNGIGAAAICWACKIMPVRVTDDTYGFATSSNVAAGITWAADHGARIAAVGYALTDDSTVKSAAQYLYNKGGVVTMPSGNAGTFDSTPDNPYVITVGSTDMSDVIMSWSNTGNNLDLVAPACNGAATSPNNGYAQGCGTSMSAAMVAGVAGLVLSVNSALTPTQITSILQQSTDDLGTAGWDSTYGRGRINALKAVNNASSGGGSTATITAVMSSLNPSISGQSVIFTATVSPSAATGTVTFLDGTTTLGTGTLSAGVATFATSSLAAGTHSITAKYGGGGSYSASTSSAISQVVNTTTKTNTTTSVTSSVNPSTYGQTVTFTATVSSSAATGTVAFYDGGSALGSSALSSGIARFSTSGLSAGSHSITATYGGNSSYNGSTSSALGQTVNSTTIDTTPPTAPTNLTYAPPTNTQVPLRWTASTDNVGVAGYKVFRAQLSRGPSKGSMQIGTSTTTSFTDANVKSGVTYAYTVYAYDAAGNVSAASNTLTLTVP